MSTSGVFPTPFAISAAERLLMFFFSKCSLCVYFREKEERIAKADEDLLYKSCSRTVPSVRSRSLLRVPSLLLPLDGLHLQFCQLGQLVQHILRTIRVWINVVVHIWKETMHDLGQSGEPAPYLCCCCCCCCCCCSIWFAVDVI